MTLKHNFDEVIDRTHTNSSKWLKYPAGVLPMGVADSDFKCPQPGGDAVTKLAQFGVYGYPYVNEGGFEKASVAWCKRRLRFDVRPGQCDYVPSLGTALAVAVKAFTEPGDKVLMQSPIYPPFTAVTVKNSRTPVYNSLKFVDGNYQIDFDDFEKCCADPKVKLFLLCNPHNPTGRCFTREELERMVEICAKHNIVIFSDEVHSDFVYAPHKHVSLPTISETARNICMVGLNPSKTFNIAGLRTAGVVSPSADPKIQQEYQHALASCKLGRNIFGDLAYQICFGGECDYYAEQVRDYVKGNIDYAVEALNKIPGIKAYTPDATYLLWIDCNGLGFETQEELDKFAVEVCKVGLNPGESFGKEGKGFKIAMQTLDGGRIGIASQALGLGEGAVEEAIKYTKERVQFGKRISQFQNTQFQLADMHTRMQAAQYVVYAAAMKKQNHEPYSMDAAMAKLFAAEAASDVTRRAVQLFGGYGYTREYPVERMMRDAKITEIYEGTSEVQRMVISSHLGVK